MCVCVCVKKQHMHVFNSKCNQTQWPLREAWWAGPGGRGLVGGAWWAGPGGRGLVGGWIDQHLEDIWEVVRSVSVMKGARMRQQQQLLLAERKLKQPPSGAGRSHGRRRTSTRRYIQMHKLITCYYVIQHGSRRSGLLQNTCSVTQKKKKRASERSGTFPPDSG